MSFLIKGLGTTPWVDLEVGSKGQNSTFSEHGHVAYQIDGNHKCSYMVVANILSACPDTPPDPGDRVKKSICSFSEHGHVAGNQICSNMVSNIFWPQALTRPPPPPPGPEDWVERSNFNFSEHGHVAYQI